MPHRGNFVSLITLEKQASGEKMTDELERRRHVFYGQPNSNQHVKRQNILDLPCILILPWKSNLIDFKNEAWSIRLLPWARMYTKVNKHRVCTSDREVVAPR